MVFFNLQNTMHVSCMFIPSEIFRMFGMLLVPLVFHLIVVVVVVIVVVALLVVEVVVATGGVTLA